LVAGTVKMEGPRVGSSATNFRSTRQDAQICVDTVVEFEEGLEAEEDSV